MSDDDLARQIVEETDRELQHWTFAKYDDLHPRQRAYHRAVARAAERVITARLSDRHDRDPSCPIESDTVQQTPPNHLETR